MESCRRSYVTGMAKKKKSNLILLTLGPRTVKDAADNSVPESSALSDGGAISADKEDVALLMSTCCKQHSSL